jgi:hypothetical protein
MAKLNPEQRYIARNAIAAREAKRDLSVAPRRVEALDNRNLRAEQLEALASVMDLIDEAAALLHAGKVKEANDKIHDARQRVNLVRAGDRQGELGAPI